MKNLKNLKRVLVMVLCLGIFLGSSMGVEAASKKQVQLTVLTFDADYYYNTYPDLQAAIGYDEAALYNHYLQYGLKEGRSGSAEFNCLAYMCNYEDLCAAFGWNYTAYCQHYEQHGKSEGRNAATKFDPDAEPAMASADVFGTYTTYYDGTMSRATNVEVAASRINGVVLQPGQEFSFSKTVLPRTKANGYVQGEMIKNGKFVMGTGGGICQVSSTLYAAMVSTELPATERYPHSLPVDYISRDLEAAIASNYKDLKFVNVFDKPIQIQATADNASGTLTVSIVGCE